MEIQSIPDNVYSRQLFQGFHWLRFSPPLEREYRQHMSETQARYQKLAILLALAIWILFAVVDITRLQLLQGFPNYNSNIWMVVLIRWSIMLALAMLAIQMFAGRMTKYAAKAAAFTLFSIGVGTALLVVLYRLEGVALSDSVQLLLIIAIFFPLGLSFYGSILVALSVSLITILIGLMMLQGEMHEDHIRLTCMLLLAVLVGAVGGYIREHVQREQFLLRHLLSWQANHDPLTGLNNRRSFSLHLETVLRQTRREGVGLALVMIDIDHFKLFNDTYGHPAGDQALQRVGQALQGFARRPMDMAVRVGGEEFALLLYATEKVQVSELTKQLQAALAALHIPHATSPTASHLTASIGAIMAMPDDSNESLYQRSDALLYQAKQAGRNRVTLG
ncbi:sensor domain-containing diguanylate cyclase [Pseudomonas cavernicola]|uniref:GGDEF domain-containing protein n=1 Tax=Pseudomonas cavernicola TaxID=2320866 RepID=UPI0013143F89|nr:GGDEF domain-containing protein [Pseudomonas cavernicola]